MATNIVRITERGIIEWRKDEGGSGSFAPGDDVSGEEQHIQDKAAEIWTPEVISDYSSLFDHPPKVVNLERNLSRREFFKLLAVTGLEDTWDTLEQYLKTNDINMYAELRSQRESTHFELPLTLQFVAQIRPLAATLTPDVDLSDTYIKAEWVKIVQGA